MINNSLLLDRCNSISKNQQVCSCSDGLPSSFNDVNDIQTIHHSLYPVLFQYVNRFIREETISDTLIADLFFQMVKNDELNGDLKQMILFSLKSAREVCADYLHKDLTLLGELIEFVTADFDEILYKDLLLLNEMHPIAKELIFLKYGFGLDLYHIAKILNLPYQEVALIYSTINEKMQ